MNMKTLVVICIACLCIAAMPAIAQENNTTTNGNETNVTATPTPTAEPNVTETATPVPTEAKFRVGPTVTLRPVNDVIDKSQDGLVELYMNNPSLNDVTLTADVQISVPSGIHVYGEGFGYGGAAGTVAGKFTVPPGTVRTIHVNLKGEKVGDFTVHFTGLYWPDDDKDAFQQISLTHPLTVKEPSPRPLDSEPTGGAGETGETSTDTANGLPLPSGLLSVIAIVVAFGALMIRKG
ncbi:MAG: hypothetical protein C5S52_00385 [ANME-2 cluster archaeon]|nr:hypothetical protein [ANME-2 cluster archaeon]